MANLPSFNWTLVKTIIARAIVDVDFRNAMFGEGADMRAVANAAGYSHATDDELAILSCNSPESFDERFVNIDTMAEYWELAMARIKKAASGRTAEAGPLPPPGTPEAFAEGL